MQYKTSDYRANNISRYEKCPVNQYITSFRGIGHTYYIIKPSNPKSIAFLLYFQFDFIRSLEYTIVDECSCKVIYGEIKNDKRIESSSSFIRSRKRKWENSRRVSRVCISGIWWLCLTSLWNTPTGNWYTRLSNRA